MSESEASSSVTPVSLVAGVLRSFSCVAGYPLRVTRVPDGGGCRVEFCWWFLLAHMAACSVKLVPLVLVAAYLGREESGDRASAARDALAEIGLSSLDALSQFVLILITGASIMTHLVCTVRSRHQLADFDSHMGRLSPHFPSEKIGNKCKRAGVKSVRALAVLGVAVTALIAVAWHELAEIMLGESETWLKVVTLLILTVQALLGFFSPVVLAGEFVVMYLIDYVTGHLKEWGDRMGEGDGGLHKGIEDKDVEMEGNQTSKVYAVANDEDHQPKPPLDLEKHLRVGLDLCKGLDKLNDVVGDCVFNIFFTNTLSAILTSYASFSVLFCDKTTHTLALFSLTYLVLTVLFLGRLYQMTSTGQKLISALNDGRVALEDHLVRDPAKMAVSGDGECPVGLEFLVEVVRSRLDGSKAAISPLSFFTLSKVGFVSGIGTILTYIIVLMQFKASEGQPAATSEN